MWRFLHFSALQFAALASSSVNSLVVLPRFEKVSVFHLNADMMALIQEGAEDEKVYRKILMEISSNNNQLKVSVCVCACVCACVCVSV